MFVVWSDRLASTGNRAAGKRKFSSGWHRVPLRRRGPRGRRGRRSRGRTPRFLQRASGYPLERSTKYRSVFRDGMQPSHETARLLSARKDERCYVEVYIAIGSRAPARLGNWPRRPLLPARPGRPRWPLPLFRIFVGCSSPFWTGFLGLAHKPLSPSPGLVSNDLDTEGPRVFFLLPGWLRALQTEVGSIRAGPHIFEDGVLIGFGRHDEIGPKHRCRGSWERSRFVRNQRSRQGPIRFWATDPSGPFPSAKRRDPRPPVGRPPGNATPPLLLRIQVRVALPEAGPRSWCVTPWNKGIYTPEDKQKRLSGVSRAEEGVGRIHLIFSEVLTNFHATPLPCHWYALRMASCRSMRRRRDRGRRTCSRYAAESCRSSSIPASTYSRPSATTSNTAALLSARSATIGTSSRSSAPVSFAAWATSWNTRLTRKRLPSRLKGRRSQEPRCPRCRPRCSKMRHDPIGRSRPTESWALTRRSG